MQAQHFLSWFTHYRSQAASQNERRLILLSGTDEWALSLLQTIDLASDTLVHESDKTNKASYNNSVCLVYGDSKCIPANIKLNRYRDKLGSESKVVIFADSQMNADAFAALSGTLVAGGIFFLVLPEIAQKQQSSAFSKRLLALIGKDAIHEIISQSQVSIEQKLKEDSELESISLNNIYPLACATSEQYLAVQAIDKVVSGHRKRPLVLTADRGRGKSSALAIACAQLLLANDDKNFSVVITSPDKQSLSVFFRQLSESLPQAVNLGNIISLNKASLRFMPVDQLLKQPEKINLLLVDEAAAIPVYQLEQLLNNYHRTVFSSTVHGYEGAGRGFTLKFKKVLKRVCPQWQGLHIHQPIRWREHDPLERFVFDACLLNAELAEIKNISDRDIVYKVITTSELVDNESLLRQVFAVLVTAHYQTKPSDLKLLLDNSKVQLVCLFSSSEQSAEVIAVALLMNEGKTPEIDESDIDAIRNSQRRLKNHFLPQSLLSHCGFEQAFDFKYLRIMRIAVHPELQQQGIGSLLLEKIDTFAQQQQVDFIGTSFGVNEELLAFWLKAGFETTRIGFTQDKASGEHSALLIKANNTDNKVWQKLLNNNFYRSFDYLLLEEYQSLSSELVFLLLQHHPREVLVSLSDFDIANVSAFVKGERLYSSCAYSLYLWLKHDIVSLNKSCDKTIRQQVLILIARLIRKQSIEFTCQHYHLTGKKMLNETLQAYVKARFKTE